MPCMRRPKCKLLNALVSNWDPFLYQAFRRNRTESHLPHAAYLHGNLAIGYCAEHKVRSANGSVCGRCGKPLMPSALLYPVAQKNYSADFFISTEWGALRQYLGAAFVLTIFGYGAPTSDIEALELMQSAWGDRYHRDLEEIEIIDLKPQNELKQTWAPFIHTHHYRTANDFYSSILASFPTRTCESLWQELMEIEFLNYGCRIPRSAPFEELWNWRRALQS